MCCKWLSLGTLKTNCCPSKELKMLGSGDILAFQHEMESLSSQIRESKRNWCASFVANASSTLVIKPICVFISVSTIQVNWTPFSHMTVMRSKAAGPYWQWQKPSKQLLTWGQFSLNQVNSGSSWLMPYATLSPRICSCMTRSMTWGSDTW